MSATGKLSGTLKKDINNSFKKLINECSLHNYENVIDRAVLQLESELKNKNLPDAIKYGLQKGFELVKLLSKTDNIKSKKIGVAAFEYLLDPWDIIPDFISNDGLLDDIYVLEKAIILINAEESKNEENKNDYSDSMLIEHSEDERLILQIGGALGPHLAKRTKDLGILNGFQRKALFDIGRKQLYGYELSIKQHSFFETLVENAISEGLLNQSCPDSPCKYCSKLESIFSNIHID